MFNYLRNLTKPAEEKRQEQITAYVDGELSPREQQRFEQLMANDPGLQAEVADLQQFKQNLRQLPRRRVPRNFTLDPELYQAPQRQPLLQLYPAMRVATVLTAVFLIIAVSAELLTFGANFAEPIAMQYAPADEAAMDTTAIETTEEMDMEADAVEQETQALESIEEAEPVAEDAPAQAAPPEPQLEIAAGAESGDEAEAEAMEAEEMAAEAPPEDPAPQQMTKETPVDIETNGLTTEGTMVDDGAEDSVAEGDASQAAVAPTPTPAGTATPDTPRIQPTPTLADRAAEPQPAATELAVKPEPTEPVELDLDAETAVSAPQTLVPSPRSPLRIIQIMLAVLLVVLVTAVWYTRRQL